MSYLCEGTRDGAACGVAYGPEEAGDPHNLCPQCRRALLATMASEHIDEIRELELAASQAHPGIPPRRLFGVMILISGKVFHTVVQPIDHPNLLELARRIPFLERNLTRPHRAGRLYVFVTNNEDHTLLSVRLAKDEV
jgi:hypothetical protein